MNNANEKRDLKHRIDYKEFYNDAINRDIKMHDHFLVWKTEKEKAKVQNREVDKYRVFSLCFYPWILDAATKSEILKLANKSQ